MQAEMDFAVYATAQSNWARQKNAPPKPDADGLFDAAGVDIICGRRQCYFEVGGELFGTVQFKETRIPLTAIAPGRWDPVAILSACTRAHGNETFTVDYATAKPANPGGIDELRIAAVVGADGIRPYLSKTSRYFEGGGAELPPLRQPAAAERVYTLLRRDGAGKPTWAFRSLLFDREGPRKSDYKVRRCLRALEDAGFMHIEIGPRGGMATAKCTWLPRAYLAPERLAPEDEAAMQALA